ncbi:hypothetical protein HPB48_019700 [Haemaphysalis longicornis]|uniref:Uncharacterized protein n=1 Tax=Haemaphysalis longicornis TaxID=44386 RepID=A0A9J6G2I2_HAELO|nr:hypothetical protein HPB48_019700 [Haemaphysalis longicornis]
MLRNRFNVSELSRVLDDYTIFVEPLDVHGPSYDSTFIPLRDGTVQLYAGIFMSTLHGEVNKGQLKDGRFRLCYLLPVNALSFTLEGATQTAVNSSKCRSWRARPQHERSRFSLL